VSYPGDSRTVEKIIADILDAAGASAEIVSRGKDAWSEDRILRLAGEAVINRIGFGQQTSGGRSGRNPRGALG